MFKTVKNSIERFNEAASFTGQRIRKLLYALPKQIKADTSEIRIRCGRPVMLSGMYGDIFLCENAKISYIPDLSVCRVSINDIEQCFHTVCGYSVHTHQNGICKGFVTLSGGHRAGIAGTAVCDKNGVSSIRDISSINIRVSREYIGCADYLFKKVNENNTKSLIVAGTPSSGKTTLLRDFARLVAGEEGGYRKTVIIDEREEIAACSNGIPGNSIGISCDVLSGYPKREAVLIAVRSMAPQNIIIDEIGSIEEAAAIEEGVNTGVDFFLSVHAADERDLLRRPQISRLLDTGAFSHVAFLSGRDNPSQVNRFISVEELKCLN